MLLQVAVLDLPFTFISKKGSEKVPCMAAWLRALGVILFDRGDRGSVAHALREAVRRLKTKDNSLIFPEEAKSRGGVMHPIQIDFMQPASMAKAYIVPIVLKNSYNYIDVMEHEGMFRIHIPKPLYYKDYKPLKMEGATVQLQEEMQRVLGET